MCKHSLAFSTSNTTNVVVLSPGLYRFGILYAKALTYIWIKDRPHLNGIGVHLNLYCYNLFVVPLIISELLTFINPVNFSEVN